MFTVRWQKGDIAIYQVWRQIGEVESYNKYPDLVLPAIQLHVRLQVYMYKRNVGPFCNIRVGSLLLGMAPTLIKPYHKIPVNNRHTTWHDKTPREGKIQRATTTIFSFSRQVYHTNGNYLYFAWNSFIFPCAVHKILRRTLAARVATSLLLCTFDAGVGLTHAQLQKI